MQTTTTVVSRILTENILTISAAIDELENVLGKRPNKTTVHRWIHRGVGSTKLEAIRLGREVFTSRQALTRFIESRTANSI